MNSVTTTNQYQLAGRGARLGAALLDIVIFAACLAPGIIAMSSSDSDMGKGVGIALLVIAWLGLMIVQAVFLIKRGQSLGKMAVGIKIVRVSDESVPGFVKVFLLRMFVPNLLYGIPYLGVVLLLVDLLFIFREDRRCLHDLIAETKVVDATEVIAPAIVAPASRPTFATSASPAYAPTPSNAPVRNSQSSPDTISMSTSTTSPEAAPSSTLQTSQQAPAVAPIAFDEDAAYEVVANEMESGKTDKGLWTRLFAELDGDEKKTKIAYIKQRAEKLMVAERVRTEQRKREEVEQLRQAEEEQLRQMTIKERIQKNLVGPEEAAKLADGFSTQFLLMCQRGTEDQVEEMLKQRPVLVAVTNSEGYTGLHIAVQEGRERMVKLLIEHGSNPDAQNQYGLAPYDLAMRKCDGNISEYPTYRRIADLVKSAIRP